jgi:hypothetical protein
MRNRVFSKQGLRLRLICFQNRISDNQAAFRISGIEEGSDF